MKMIRAWRRRDLKKQTNLVTRAWQSTWQGKVTRQSIWQTCDRTVWHQKLQPIRKQNTLTHQTKTGYKNSRFGTWNFRRPWPSEVAVLYQLVVESTGSWRQTGRGTTRGGRPLTAGCWVSGSWRSTRRLQRQLTTGNWRCFVPVLDSEAKLLSCLGEPRPAIVGYVQRFPSKGKLISRFDTRGHPLGIKKHLEQFPPFLRLWQSFTERTLFGNMNADLWRFITDTAKSMTWQAHSILKANAVVDYSNTDWRLLVKSCKFSSAICGIYLMSSTCTHLNKRC